MKEFYEANLASYPDFKIAVEDMIAEGNKAAVRFVFSGTHRALGRKIRVTGFEIWRAENGKIVEDWEVADEGSLLRQLGYAFTPPLGIKTAKAGELVELAKLDPTIKLDIRYATTNNFVGRVLYPEARAFLQRPAAEALWAVHRRLKERGYGLVVYDAYRPWSVTKLFWEVTPPEKRDFVADPEHGSVHNRGCAVDVGLYDLKTGMVVEMPGGYDEMTERSYVTYAGGTAEQRAARDLLRQAMERDGVFSVYDKEWWHYDYKDFLDYWLQDIPFSAIKD